MEAHLKKSEMTGRYVITFQPEPGEAEPTRDSQGNPLPKSKPKEMARIRVDVHDAVMAEARKLATEMTARQTAELRRQLAISQQRTTGPAGQTNVLKR